MTDRARTDDDADDAVHSEPGDSLAAELAHLPAPAIDAALSARVLRRGRAAHRDRAPRLRLDELAVPALLLIAGIFYTATSFELMLRIFAG